ncbi:DUF4179 domain-containing protein [Clostridium sp. YIM B02505]|uniref:DUF4179 domain-containing protein n=1 Tax=Clostridium yunnanense TaxID=2800325 RepID=A0ABS1EU22_9CLOT|nr:DUF4179 domain-containing protein [Clostridium yunnanense]MBK1812834.1 DUF4179 domain-containing protein [Clostridium yunnanense]
MNKLDDFDMLLKKKAKEDTCYISGKLDASINDTLDNLVDNRRYKRPITKVAMIAALVATISGTTVFASTNPVIRNMVGGIVAYFDSSKDTKYISDKSSFEKFNKAVGVSSVDKDIKFTVNNIATDDNFINVFYTIESKNDIKMFTTEQEAKLFGALLYTPFINVNINGKEIKCSNNNNMDAYFQGDKGLKGMWRVNVSQIDLPNKFNLEISTDEIFRTKGKWEVATSVDKSDISIETKTVKPNIQKVIDLGDYKPNITIDKVSISPFGNQIVISERTSGDRLFDTFAIFDDKDNNLDVLNTDMIGSINGKATNSFEFVKGNVDTKYITLIPIKFTEKEADATIEKVDIQKVPISFKTNNAGSRVVDKIEFVKNVIRINYHNEGVQMWDPGFYLYDSKGNEVDLGQNGYTTAVDRKTGEFTQTLTFENKNVDFSKISKIGTFTEKQDIDLLKDQAIKIDLK